jgi:hypothetical protein
MAALFEDLKSGLDEVKAYLSGQTAGCKITPACGCQPPTAPTKRETKASRSFPRSRTTPIKS